MSEIDDEAYVKALQEIEKLRLEHRKQYDCVRQSNPPCERIFGALLA